MPIGFILNPTYRVQRNRPVVQLHGRLQSGESFLVRDDRLVPHFFIPKTAAPTARRLGLSIVEDGDWVTLTGEPACRVDFQLPGDGPALRDRLTREGVTTFEADVLFGRRYLINHGIRGSLRIVGDASPGEGIDLVFDNPQVEPADWTPQLRVLSLDIETDPRAQQLLSIGFDGCGVKEVWLVDPGCAVRAPEARVVGTERALLQACVKRIRELDPDVLTGWNVIGFDLAVLLRLGQRHGVRMRLGRGPEPARIRNSGLPRAAAQADVCGRVVLDGIQLLRGTFVKVDSYALGAVAKQFLGQTKLIQGSDRADEILRLYRNDPDRLVAYNLRDAELVTEILDKLDLIELSVERSRLTGMPPDRVTASIASFDFLYLSELHRRRIVAPSVRTGAFADTGNRGGHVLEPKSGLHHNVLVLDFKSLYPSLIRTFQIDPLGYARHHEAERSVIVAPNGAAFRRTPGILPQMLDELFPRREAAKAAGNAVASQAIKILMNSFYGVLGTSACRFANPALANAITDFGREILLWSKAELEASGFDVLYGDTDSLFVASGTTGVAEARALGADLAERLNRDLAGHIRERWDVESKLELEFERLYLRLVLPEARSGAAGARKRYVGSVESEDGVEVHFVGMEAVRRDWTDLAKRVQHELYQRLFTDQPLQDYLRDTVAAVREGNCDAELVYRKALRKPLNEYTASTPPHVAAARKLRGRLGRSIRYVMTLDGPEPVTQQTSQLDREHYVQKQVRPVAEPVLALLGLKFDRVIGDATQLDLF